MWAGRVAQPAMAAHRYRTRPSRRAIRPLGCRRRTTHDASNVDKDVSDTDTRRRPVVRGERRAGLPSTTATLHPPRSAFFRSGRRVEHRRRRHTLAAVTPHLWGRTHESVLIGKVSTPNPPIISQPPTTTPRHRPARNRTNNTSLE